jgi:hypothetical protein
VFTSGTLQDTELAVAPGWLTPVSKQITLYVFLLWNPSNFSLPFPIAQSLRAWGSWLRGEEQLPAIPFK